MTNRWSILHLTSTYRKTPSRGAYGHDPLWSVFEECPLDSTRSDNTMTIIYNINSAVVISVVVESSRCSSKTLQKGSCPYAPLDEVYGTGEIQFPSSSIHVHDNCEGKRCRIMIKNSYLVSYLPFLIVHIRGVLQVWVCMSVCVCDCILIKDNRENTLQTNCPQKA